MHAYDVLLEVHDTTTAVVAVRALYMLLFSMHQHVAIQDLLQRSCEIAYCTHKLNGIVYPMMHVPLGNCPEPNTAHLAGKLLISCVSQHMASKVRWELRSVLTETAAIHRTKFSFHAAYRRRLSALPLLVASCCEILQQPTQLGALHSHSYNSF